MTRPGSEKFKKILRERESRLIASTKQLADVQQELSGLLKDIRGSALLGGLSFRLREIESYRRRLERKLSELEQTVSNEKEELARAKERVASQVESEEL